MLTTLIKGPFSRPGWLFERKLNGESGVVFRRGHDLQLFSCNQELLNVFDNGPDDLAVASSNSKAAPGPAAMPAQASRTS